MPLITLDPKTRSIEDRLDQMMHEIRREIVVAVQKVWDLSVHDIIVDLLVCTKRNPDSVCSDLVLILRTNPNKELEATANKLRDELMVTLTTLGLDVDLSVEVWLQFIPGPWILVINDIKQDSVDHNPQ